MAGFACNTADIAAAVAAAAVVVGIKSQHSAAAGLDRRFEWPRSNSAEFADAADTGAPFADKTADSESDRRDTLGSNGPAAAAVAKFAFAASWARNTPAD